MTIGEKMEYEREEAREEGINIGKAEGREEGLAEGISIGKKENQKEFLNMMLADPEMTDEKIQKYCSEYTIEEIAVMRQNRKPSKEMIS